MKLIHRRTNAEKWRRGRVGGKYRDSENNNKQFIYRVSGLQGAELREGKDGHHVTLISYESDEAVYAIGIRISRLASDSVT